MRAFAAHDTSARLGELEHADAGRPRHRGPRAGRLNGRQIASLIPAPLELLDGVGHMFWWEQPGRSAALIRDHALAPV